MTEQPQGVFMKRFPRIAIWALILFWPFIGAATDAPDKAIDDLLDGIEKRYAGKGFSARFFQESMLKALQISDTAEGKLIVKRPDKMRWEYRLPDEQTIISDGTSLWIYRPQDNQVMVGKAPDFFGQGKGAGFLTDMNQIRKSFRMDMEPADNAAYHRLVLVPIKANNDLTRVVLSVAKTTFQVDQIITFNAYGDETIIVLSDYHFNLEPDNGLFKLDIPEGVDVVQVDKP
jgi:outer membrane lipoprotein carrier protein